MTYTGDYFDLDEILATEQPVKTRFKVSGWRLGYLDPLGLGVEDGRNEVDDEKEHDEGSVSDSDSEESQDDDDDDDGFDIDAGRELELKRQKRHHESPGPSSHHHYQQQSAPADLMKGSSIDLPLWLSLSLTARGFADFETPAAFQKAVCNELMGDPKSVSLFSRNKYFFLLGGILANYLKDVDLSLLLTQSFGARCWNIIDASNNVSAREIHASLLMSMDSTEQRLFFTTLKTARAGIRWKERQAHCIETSSLMNHGKSAFGGQRPRSNGIVGAKRTLA